MSRPMKKEAKKLQRFVKKRTGKVGIPLMVWPVDPEDCEVCFQDCPHYKQCKGKK